MKTYLATQHPDCRWNVAVHTDGYSANPPRRFAGEGTWGLARTLLIDAIAFEDLADDLANAFESQVILNMPERFELSEQEIGSFVVNASQPSLMECSR